MRPAFRGVLCAVHCGPQHWVLLEGVTTYPGILLFSDYTTKFSTYKIGSY
eukprot:SAG11_NODE_824_length_6993_cov_1.875290_8_plen_50_part_00